MKLRQYVGIVDLGIITVILAGVVMPPREMHASPVLKTEPARFEVALAEARTLASPGDGAATAELARRLGDAGQKDWAIEVALAGAERAKESPSRWRALLAASMAYVDRLDVVPGLDYADRALSSCDGASQACPSWEQVRMQLYQRHLAAGVKSGIDPRHDPVGFRKAGESALRQIRLKQPAPPERTIEPPAPAPAPEPAPAPAP